MKVVGTGVDIIENSRIKKLIVNSKYGKPSIRINNKLKALIKKKFKTTKINTLLSISDEKKYSIAFVIFQK